MLHAFDHFAPHRILAVKEHRIIKTDEELAVRAVRIGGTGHRANAAHMGFAAEFGGKIGTLRYTHAGARGIADLRHETRDHAVKDDAVINTPIRQAVNMLTTLGSQ